MQDFTKNIQKWYANNKRALPWRATQDPYHIWVSEIILQQTRVNQGINYYHNFIKAFPDIKTLEKAGPERILKIWQGLGYYNRALNMLTAAKTVVKHHNSTFPSDFATLISLKGIGEYTASAICSISANQPYAVVDGNVTRVISRIFGIDNKKKSDFEKKIKAIAGSLLDTDQPGTFNQAIMEFGAIQCKPANPNCRTCIFRSSCIAFNHQLIKELPPKQKLAKKRLRYFNYFFLSDKNNVFIKKRKEKDIWSGLFDFPMVETKSNSNYETIISLFSAQNSIQPENLSITKIAGPFHSFLSHQTIILHFYEANTRQAYKLNEQDLIITDKFKLNEYTFPITIIKYLKQKGLIK